MTSRACGQRARIGRKAPMRSGRQTCGFIGDDPSVDRQAAHGVIGTGQRQYTGAVVKFNAVDVVDNKLCAAPSAPFRAPCEWPRHFALRRTGHD